MTTPFNYEYNRANRRVRVTLICMSITLVVLTFAGCAWTKHVTVVAPPNVHYLLKEKANRPLAIAQAIVINDIIGLIRPRAQKYLVYTRAREGLVSDDSIIEVKRPPHRPGQLKISKQMAVITIDNVSNVGNFIYVKVGYSYGEAFEGYDYTLSTTDWQIVNKCFSGAS